MNLCPLTYISLIEIDPESKQIDAHAPADTTELRHEIPRLVLGARILKGLVWEGLLPEVI